MGESDEPSLPRSVTPKTAALGLSRLRDKRSAPPLQGHDPFDGTGRDTSANGTASNGIFDEKHEPRNKHSSGRRDSRARGSNAVDETSSSPPPPAPPPAEGEKPAAIDPKPPYSTRIKNGTGRFANHTKNAIFHSWINVLLIFVPIGIAAHVAHLNPEIIFSMNAIAIIPLAGLLAHATEAVAARVGDTLGALLNVSFGNAVELILFIILLAAGQIEVVQAALLGSILANLLLILGMAFLLGGLRYQEQVYNSTVTQMSACMLSLAVMSLLLPTAFHAAFSSNAIADKQTLQVSRGTSVVLLVVYVLYLLFQLKSHAYMYASTPQHIIDEESHPGVMAEIWNSSSDSSSDANSSDSDSTTGSHATAKSRIRRTIRKMRRKSSTSFKDKDMPSAPSVMSSPSVEQHKSYFDLQRGGSVDDFAVETSPVSRRASLGAIVSGDEADVDDRHAPIARDFETGSSGSPPAKTRNAKKSRTKTKKHRKQFGPELDEDVQERTMPVKQTSEPAPKVVFAEEVQQGEAAATLKRPQYRPAFSLLSNNVFVNPQTPAPIGAAVPNLRVAAVATPRGLRRTNSEPGDIRRLNSQASTASRPVAVRGPTAGPATAALAADGDDDEPELMSRTAAVMMLVISTALVAVCADFMSESIEPMIASTNVSQAFIGLIILPIVGNAAEHVTAVTVAMKNKMDLAIGVAVGSSIQIAIFITPFIVILGWMMGKPMTLYFNIFETVALFVTAFVVNFLVLDGRSNYLEGSLLIAAYVIIALASFFYPDGCDASQIGGSDDRCAAGTTAAAAVIQAGVLAKRMLLG